MSERNITKLIRVEDALPEVGQRVWIVCGYHPDYLSHTSGYLNSNGKWNLRMGNSGATPVRAWMPIPEMPEINWQSFEGIPELEGDLLSDNRRQPIDLSVYDSEFGEVQA